MWKRQKKLFLECEQIYAEVYGQDHSETLDAARRAQNVGQECENDNEEEGEEEELVLLQARPVRYKCTTKQENSSVLRHVSNGTNGTSVIRSVKLCLPVAGNLSACLPACLCLPRGDKFPKYSQTPPTPSCKYSNAC